MALTQGSDLALRSSLSWLCSGEVTSEGIHCPQIRTPRLHRRTQGAQASSGPHLEALGPGWFFLALQGAYWSSGEFTVVVWDCGSGCVILASDHPLTLSRHQANQITKKIDI